MKKDLIFFGDSGLTNTSANYIANLAKELYNSIEKELNNIVFYTTTVKLIGSKEESLIQGGVTSVDDIPNKLNDIAQLKSLIAWLREAIKAKDRLYKEYQAGDYEYYGIVTPEIPERDEDITVDDVIATFNIKQRNRYYYLETLCSTIGKYIHNDGKFSIERDKLFEILYKTHEVSGSGRDTILYTRTASLNVHDVEQMFLKLQATYREYQAELNSIKHEIEDIVNKDIANKNIQYQKAYEQYRLEMSLCSAELETKRKEAVDSVSKLKIIIPDSLKSIYDKVQSVGKK